MRIVRSSDGQIVCAFSLERTSPDAARVEAILEEGQEAEDVEVEPRELLNTESFLTKYTRGERR